ncbi:hypothetical protein ANANG_G00241450 [Anguilla anguilla]|uniref:RING-type E3 ubiquitin transferase n=1 Tax=Anguilla anguilla TaxID=7936 RepID=A0A9D3RP20_ANGAN|nr:hypothetical protein ANANG_G00241450 [Anguilla anguilla]
MAAAGPAKSPSGLIGQREKQKSRNGAKDEQPEEKETTRSLTLEEARCPVCHEIFLEPVTMPCRHSVCLPCFKQAVQFTSLCCPLCRLRVSSWARRQSREKGLVNTELWDMVRQSYPEKCKRRMERQEGEEKIFCSPAHICKPGDIRQDYELQKNKVVVKEEKKRTQPHQKMEECGIPKHFQNSIFGVLSDLENEEPAGRRSRHVSAFVRKTRSSPASSRISLQNRVVQRSRSCTDGEEGRAKDGCPPRLSAMAEASIAYSYNAGILLSTENSRSLSAPALASERRLPWRGIAVATASKPERSISPESNDSISEELNHFKPIVCSPCTPPKRLPDGRFLQPTVVKSTPRNLSRGLHKPTSYEASPTILQKWRQIETDRQLSRVSSRGTGTSPALKTPPQAEPRGEGQEEAGRVGTGRAERAGHGQGPDPARPAEGHRLLRGVGGAGGGGRRARGGAGRAHPAPVQQAQRQTTRAAGAEGQPRPQKQPEGHARVPQGQEEEPEDQAPGGVGRARRVCDGERRAGRLYERSLQQERQDRQLALKLQRQFNMEAGKSSPDRYLLRSWAFPDGHAEYSPRRSVRISKKS